MQCCRNYLANWLFALTDFMRIRALKSLLMGPEWLQNVEEQAMP